MGGTVAFVFAAYGASEQHEAAKEQRAAAGRQLQAQKEQQRQQKKLADIKATRERRKLAREARIARSEIAVATGGAAGGSRAAGVGGSVATQSASAQGFAGQQHQVGQSIFEQGLLASQASADIASAQSRGQIGGAIGSLAGTGYSIFK